MRRRSGSRCLASAIVFLGLALGAAAVLAQTKKEDQPSKRLSQVLQIIDQVAVIKAGQGLKSIQLGDSFELLQSRWGDPHTSKKTGLLKRQLRWHYNLDENALIEFSGKKTIDKISAYGTRHSIVTTAKGIGFESNKAATYQQYGEPKKQKDDELNYPEQGIRFAFEKAQLRRIDVFEPE